MTATLDYRLYRDLLGQPWDGPGFHRGPDGYDCCGLVAEVYDRMGIRLALDLTDGFEEVQEPAPGDLVAMTLGGVAHQAVYLGDGRILHVAARSPHGVRATPLRAAQRAGKVAGFYRYAGPVAIPTVSPAASDVAAILCTDLMRPWRREVATIPWHEGLTIGDIAPPAANVVIVGGETRLVQDAAAEPVAAGSVVVFGAFPGDPLTLIALGIGIVLSLISTFFLPAIPKAQDTDEVGSPTFDLAGLRNTVAVGIAQPVVYGEHRVAGNIIHAYQRADDQGRSVLYMMVMLSRGPIHSIAGIAADVDDFIGDLIPDDIQIDGSPAKNYGVSVSLRLGGSNQEPMPGFNELVTAISYTKTLKVGEPFIHETTTEIQAFDILINYPLGLFNINTANGNVNSRDVVFQLRTRLSGATSWNLVFNFTHTGARRGPFTQQMTVRNLAKGKYDIEINRISPVWPETESDKESRSDLVTVNEIVQDPIAYPGKALIGIRAIATDQLAGSIPTITCKIKGRKVWVWDGVSETSPNFGTEETWTDNPAWCVADMLLNPTYGLARNGKLTLNNIDLSSFDAWADNCDLLVSDGRGGTTKRATLDLVIDEIHSGWELMQSIALSHWGRLLIANNEIRVIVEKAVSPVAVLGMGQMRDVVVTYEGRRSRPNTVEIQYFNEEANYEGDFAQKLDDTAIFTNGEAIVKESLQGVGVSRPPQAYRLAQFRANYHKLSKRKLDCTVGPEFIHILPGDVIEAQHDAAKPSTAQSGRIQASAATVVRLDHDLTITSGTNKITVRTDGTGQDVLQERTLTNGTYARNDPITITSAWDVGDTPGAGDPYVAGPTSTYYRLWRVMALETDPATLERKLSAVEYDAAIYTDDPGTVETFTDTMPDPRLMPTNVDSLFLSETTTIGADGGTVDALRVEWEPAERWHHADVWYRIRGSADEGNVPNWTHHIRTPGDNAIIAPLGAKSIVEVSVTAVAKQGSRKHPDLGTRGVYAMRGRRRRPAVPIAVLADVVNSILYVKVIPPADTTDVSGYEIRYGSTWSGSVRLAQNSPAEFSEPCQFTGTQTIRVRSVSRNGTLSATEVTDSLTVSIPGSVYLLTTTQTEHAAFSGTKTNTTVTASRLVLSGSSLSGTYAIPQIAASGTRRGMVTVRAGIQDVALYWGEAAFSWDSNHATQTWATAYLNGFEIEDGLTWKHAEWPWDGLVSTCHKWDGPSDINTDLTPTLDVVIDAGSGRATHLAERVFSASLDATLTMRRPHSRYVAEVSAMTENIYQYDIVDLTADVSGILPIANGGTSASAAVAAFNALSPVTTRGDVIVRDATNNIRLALGANRNVLTSDGTDLGYAEPFRFHTVHFAATSATAVGSSVTGLLGVTSNAAGIPIVSGKTFKLWYVAGVVTCGATVGTNYDIDLIVRNKIAATDTIVASSVNNANGAVVYFDASAADINTPIMSVAGTERIHIGWSNVAGSTGALANTVHSVTIVYSIE